MLNISLEGDSYVLNIKLPSTKFNDELLKKVVGLTHKSKDCVIAGFRSKDLNQIHRLTEKVLTILKLLGYG